MDNVDSKLFKQQKQRIIHLEFFCGLPGFTNYRPVNESSIVFRVIS